MISDNEKRNTFILSDYYKIAISLLTEQNILFSVFVLGYFRFIPFVVLMKFLYSIF